MCDEAIEAVVVNEFFLMKEIDSLGQSLRNVCKDTQIEIARFFSYNGNFVLFRSSSKVLQFISIDVPPFSL